MLVLTPKLYLGGRIALLQTSHPPSSGAFFESLLLVFVSLLVTRPWDLGAVAQSPHILPAALLLAAERFAGSLLDPLAHLGGVPHPSIGRRLQERFFEFLLLLFGK